MRVAVVGSGIAGLSAAWLLGQRHEVTLFEKHDHLGMDARSLDVPGDVSGDEADARIDVPLRVFFDGFYPNLSALYRHLGIESGAINYSASFSELHEKVYFHYDNVRVAGLSLPVLKGLRSLNPKAFRIGWEALRLFRQTRRAIASGLADEMTLEDYLQASGYSADFAEGFLYPAFSAICTCSRDGIRAYPARVILEYLDSGLLTSSMRRVTQGTQEVVERLAKNAHAVHLRSPVVDVSQTDEGARVRTAAGVASFDHVVMATQANQAARLLNSPTPAEHEALGAFTYEPSRVICHTDTRLAPAGGAARWAPVNFLLPDTEAAPMATIWLNAIQAMPGPEPVFQTWNPILEPDPELVLGQADFERPVVNADSLRGLQRLSALHEQPDRRIWFCGSYAARGIPLLESAVVSALSISRRLGVDAPWGA